MQVQGKFNVQTHLNSLVLVHVCIGQRCRAIAVQRDEESSALPTMSTRTILAGHWIMGHYAMDSI